LSLAAVREDYSIIIGTGEKNRRQVEAKSLCRLRIYGKFEARGLLNRKIRRIRALQDFINKGGRAAGHFNDVGPIRDQPSILLGI
jgi:hypothetical protein